MNLILSIFHPKADTIRQESIFAIRTIRTLILSCIVILTNHSAQASLLAEADKLYKNKKWGEAAKTYEVFASSKPMGRNYWYARLRTALAKEKIGDIKNALSESDRIIRGASGHSMDDLVGEAFLLKQRIIFRSKGMTGIRNNLLSAAVARLGWTAHVSRLHENEAIRRIRERNIESAWRIFSRHQITLSASGSNIINVLSFSRTRNTGTIRTADIINRLSALHYSDRQTAKVLIDFVRKSTTGATRIDLTCAAAELSVSVGDDERARKLYEELLSDTLDHAQRQRLRLRYAGYLKSSGRSDRCAEIYADWIKDLKSGDPYYHGMRTYVRFLIECRRYRKAKEVLDNFCTESSNIYSSTERKAILQKIEHGITSGDDDEHVQAGWKILNKANDLAKARKYDDAIKLYRTISIRHTGNLKTEALFHIGNCLCNMARYTQAASVWDELGSHGGSNLKIRCLRRKADMVLTEMRNVKSARTFYCEAMEILKSEGSNNPYELRDITTFIAICDAANGKVDDAEPVFRREYERALKRMDVNIMKWHALISACAAIREYGSYKGDTLRDVIIADLLAASGHYQEAINLFRKCLSQQHISRDLLAFAAMQMAECLDRNNQHSEALKTYQLIRIHYKDCRCAPLAMLRAGVLCVGSMNDDTGGRQFFKFIEDTWPKDSIAEQALFYRLTLAIWTEQWEEATKLRKEFFRRHPDSDKRKIVEVEYGELIARRITVLEENIIQ